MEKSIAVRGPSALKARPSGRAITYFGLIAFATYHGWGLISSRHADDARPIGGRDMPDPAAGGGSSSDPSSPYGHFPDPHDPFHFLPCTNKTVPPAVDDGDVERSWARLFDPRPEHWNWGNATQNATTAIPADGYAGRGIYLCGYLDLPLDYLNRSETRIVRLAVTKYQVSGLARVGGTPAAAAHAHDDGPVPGSKSPRTLVLNPGGPGASGTLYAWKNGERASERLAGGEFDVLGWDPRGVNASQPAISCYPFDADRDRWSLLTQQYREVTSPDAQLRLADAMNSAVMHACWNIHGDLGRFLTTATVARDLDQIRNALGEDELTAYLVSYGTGIGQTYVNMFPDRAGRIILDGTEYVRDHRVAGGFGLTSLDNVTDAWHDGVLGECVKAGPKHCALARPRHGEPVTVEGLERRMNTTITSLIHQPIAGYTNFSGPSLVTYSGLVSAIYLALYNAKSWPALAEMLYDLEAGNSTLAAAMLEHQAWEYDPSLPSPPSPRPLSDELLYLVVCGDAYDSGEKDLAWWGSLWANMTARTWISGNPRFSIVFPCRHFTTYWPKPAEVYRGNLDHHLRNPVLLIAEIYDPATPLRNGRRLAAEMGANARLIVHHGYGHSSTDTSNCTRSTAMEYILHGVLPDKMETDCFANEKPYLYGVGNSTGVHAAEAAGSRSALETWREHLEEMRLLGPGRF